MTRGGLRKALLLLSHPGAYLVLTCLVLLAHQAFYYRALGADAIDDAYISFRYARNAAAGHGLVFNVGERVEGYTNFAWTILLALFIRLGFEPSGVAIGLGSLFSLATLWLVYRFLKFASVEDSRVTATAVCCLAVDGSFAIWAVSGMETAMFAFVTLAALTSYVWEWENDRPGLLSGLLLALAAMTRPEGVLVFGVVVIHQALARLVSQRRLVQWGDLARAGVFLGVYVPYFLWRYYYYGFLLPNTFYAKVTVAGSEFQLQRGLQYLRTFLRLHLGWLLLILILVPLLKRKINFWFTSLLTVVLGYVCYITYVGGDWSVGRFFVPVLPATYILVAAGLVEVYQSLQHWMRKATRSPGASLVLRGVVLSLLIVGLGVLFNLSSLKGEYELFVVHFQAAKATHARVTMGKWLRDSVPEDTFIAVDAAGQVPYYSGLRTLDMFGVNDVHTAHLEVPEMGQGVPGHEKFDFDYIMWRQPDLIIAGAPFLDGSDAYERWDVAWANDPSLLDFLYVYRRRGWTGGGKVSWRL